MASLLPIMLPIMMLFNYNRDSIDEWTLKHHQLQGRTVKQSEVNEQLMLTDLGAGMESVLFLPTKMLRF